MGPATRTAAAGMSTRRFSCLLVDDDERYGKTTKELMESRNHISVDIATNAGVAEEKLQGTTYDCILVDNLLGTTPPWQVGSEWLLQRLPGLKDSFIVLLTGFGVDERLRNALEARGVPVVTKGTHLEEHLLRLLYSGRHPRLEGKGEVSRVVGVSRHGTVGQMMSELFMEYLEGLGDPEKQVLFVRGQMLSVEELLDEGRRGGENWNAVSEMFCDYIRHLMKRQSERKRGGGEGTE